MSDWLYPISSSSGYVFVLLDGLSLEKTPENFELAVWDKQEADWPVSTAYRQIEPGDRIWVYYGTADEDRGVVGLAIVLSVGEPQDRVARVKMRWDWERTRHLLSDPFPALEVRKYVRPIKAVHRINGDLGSRLVKHAGLNAS